MTYLSECLADNPLGLWFLDEAAAPALDKSGNGRDLTNISNLATPNQPGICPAVNKCYDFNGNAALERASEAWMSVTNFTLEAWVRMDASNGYRCIVGHDNTTTVSRNFNWYIKDGKQMFHPVASNLTEYTATSTLALSTVYYLTVTYVGTTVRFYTNGVADGTGSIGSIAFTNNVGFFDIGATFAAIGSRNFLFDGKIGPVGFYPTALSLFRIQQHYNAGLVAAAAVHTGWGMTLA